MHTDDLSSDDEAGGNAIGRVPLHWYDEFEHLGYDVHGRKVLKSKRGDGLDQAIARYGRTTPTPSLTHCHYW